MPVPIGRQIIRPGSGSVKSRARPQQDDLTRRKGVLERERAQLRAEAEPGPDPELLRERMPDVLRFIRDWVTKAERDELTLLLQALEVRVDVSPEEADVRVEVPMIEPEEGADLSPLHEHRFPRSEATRSSASRWS